MRQWKGLTNSDYNTDVRKREDIILRIKELAATYVPEWQYDGENPDIGSVIAMLFADGMEDNLKRYNTLLERDYVELMNMLGISLRPAFPAHSIVLMELAQNTIPGFRLKKGIKLIGTGEGETAPVFETAHSIYVTESRLKSAFMTSGKNGKVIPLLGEFLPVRYINEMSVVMDEEEEQAVSAEKETNYNVSAYPFSLFDFDGEGYGKYGLLFYHSHLFDVMDNDIIMQIAESPELVDGILNGRYGLAYYGDSGFEPVDHIRRVADNCLAFRKQGECRKVSEKGTEYSVLLLEPKEIPDRNVLTSGIGFSSSGEPKTPELVWNGTTELESDRFLPFGDRIGLYSELYIGHDAYFSKPGAKVTMTFRLQYDTLEVALPKKEVEAMLKVIKRKPKKDIEGAPADVFVDEVSIEYYNGIGWRKLVTDVPVRQLFGNEKEGMYEISFTCPKDWVPIESGGVSGRSIRLQVIRSDNCYFQPAIHHYPIISGMKISYTYGDRFEKPEKLYSFQGMAKTDLSLAMATNRTTPVFRISRYQDTALYLGFDRKIEDGPVSLFVQVKENEGYQTGNLAFSYSTRDGFVRLKLSDHTDGFSHTGTIRFMPPTDMVKMTLEGQEAYWLKVTDEMSVFDRNERQRPLISDICLNAVEVDNIDTMNEDEYYIDSFGPDMEFALNAQNILSLDVWVNEIGQFSEAEMRRMLAEDSENTRAEYSFLGEIEEFYVRWSEVDNFDQSSQGDRHYIVDRMNGRLRFGDGVHVQIPRNVSGIAFKVVLRKCDGDLANLETGLINESLGGLLFVNRIQNPVRAYGGMNMETVEGALRRGTGVLNSRNRLISAQDYEREVLNYSSRISQAKVIVGRQKDGGVVPGAITLVILMNDYYDGEQSFMHMRNRLREHLLSKCELSVDGSKISIVEPTFVEISVDAWVQVLRADDSFEVQQELHRVLDDYLDPIRNQSWDIGRMVQNAQIELRLNMEKGRALLKKLMVTARYRDSEGVHEVSPEVLAGNPYVLVTSGEHRIHFEQNN